VSRPGTLAVIDARSHTTALAAAWDVLAPGELVLAPSRHPPGFAAGAAVAACLARPETAIVAFTDVEGLRAAARALVTLVSLEARVNLVVLTADGDEARVEALARSGLARRRADTAEALGRALTTMPDRPTPAMIVTRTV
jgi:hypothetical protein